MATDALAILSQLGEPIFRLEDGVFLTPPGILRFGMCICSSCGHVMSVDNERCHGCGEAKCFLLDQHTNSIILSKTA